MDAITDYVYDSFENEEKQGVPLSMHLGKIAFLPGIKGVTDSSEALIAACAAAHGALQSVCLLIGPQEQATLEGIQSLDPAKVNQDLILLAAIIAHKVISPKGGSFMGEFNPNLVLQAMLDFKHLTDKKPDELMNKSLVNVAYGGCGNLDNLN